MKRRKRVWLSEAVSWRESWTAQPNLSSACYFDGELDLTPPQHRSGQLSTKLAWQFCAQRKTCSQQPHAYSSELGQLCSLGSSDFLCSEKSLVRFKWGKEIGLAREDRDS